MRAIFLALFFVLTFSAGVVATLAVQRWTANADVAMMITNAKTAADHEALASYFERQAAENRVKAAFHARLEKAYNASHPDWRLAMHCDDMAQYFSKIAEQDSELAAQHRKLSKATP